MNEKPYNLIFGPKGNVKAILMKSSIEGSEYFSILFGHWFHSILTQSFSRTNVKYEIEYCCVLTHHDLSEKEAA